MSITIDLPPAMTQEALEYATLKGTTLEQMFIDYLRFELAKGARVQDHPLAEFIGCISNRRRTDDVVSELRGYDQW